MSIFLLFLNRSTYKEDIYKPIYAAFVDLDIAKTRKNALQTLVCMHVPFRSHALFNSETIVMATLNLDVMQCSPMAELGGRPKHECLGVQIAKKISSKPSSKNFFRVWSKAGGQRPPPRPQHSSASDARRSTILS